MESPLFRVFIYRHKKKEVIFLNQTILVGRIVRDIDVRTVSMNGRVVNNVIAINRHHKNANGERLTDFIPFVAWNHHADLLKRYAAKGNQVALSGMMQSRKYSDNQGNDVYVIELLVDDITLIHSGESQNVEAKQTSAPQEQTPEAYEQRHQFDQESMKEALTQ